jgi:hypothetical protein
MVMINEKICHIGQRQIFGDLKIYNLVNFELIKNPSCGFLCIVKQSFSQEG